jgi:glycosyltransferase involved in cell wall biosynthesis
VENGLDHRPFQGTQASASSARGADRPFTFGYIGSVLPTKGVHTLVEAFVRNDRKDARLHVHGEMLGWHEVTGYETRLRELARPALERVAFLGRYGLDAVPSILASLDALVVPSLWFEAFCLTLREGFLAGVPVIVADHGAMREGMVRGDEALPFRPGDVVDLAAKMNLVQDDAALRLRLATSRKHVRTVEDNAAELASIYHALESVGGAR